MRLDDVAARGKAGLARALAQVEAAAGSEDVARLLDEAEARAGGHVIGLTGPPGVGKSTLTDALIGTFRTQGRTIGVIAVDPSSRVSGGALLGDRTRMRRNPSDEGVFVRSMAARNRLGGLADLTYPSAVLMRALMDVVIIETVGVGQSETAIAEVADTVVLCAQPGSGDAIQYMKAGIMEIPDIVVVTKSDMGDTARRTAADLRGALALAAGERGAAPPVVSLSATHGEGLDRLAGLLSARAGAPARRGAQAEAWLERHLLDHFGQEGVARVADALGNPGESGPFMRARAISARLDAALDAGLLLSPSPMRHSKA